MILITTQFELDGFQIPSFYLKQGEMIGICLYGGGHFFDLENKLANIFIGKTLHSNVEVIHQGRFVPRFIAYNRLKSLFFPHTVKRYLASHANIKNSWIEKLFQIGEIQPKLRVNRLAGNYRKLLTLFAAFSTANSIVLDLAGLDSLGAQQVLAYTREFVNQGGAAIVFDNTDESSICFNRYYKIKPI